MILAIDVGNSFTKIGVFDNGNLIDYRHQPTAGLLEDVQRLKSRHSISKGVIAFVGNLQSNQLEKLQDEISLLIVDSAVPVPFVNNYGTPTTLGVDRIALASAASKYFEGKNCLIIDAGTCVTYDFLSSDNIYYGGSISPGLNMRYKSMHHFTANLPLLKVEQEDSFIGTTTKESMHTGVVYGLIYEIEGFIDAYQNKFGDLTVILTGGDAHFLRDSLKNDIFAHPNFLLEGLNYILEFNQF